eukprot:scaffold456928_cov51-Attheya_sp.AAC.1
MATLPGSVRDTWMELSHVSRPLLSSVEEEEDELSNLNNNNNNNNHMVVIPPPLPVAADDGLECGMGRGQLGRMTRTLALQSCLERCATISEQLTLISQKRQTCVDDAKKEIASHASSSEFAGAPPRLMQSFESQLVQLRAHHAQLATQTTDQMKESLVSPLLLPLPFDPGTSRKRKYGYSYADGYSVASIVAEETRNLRRGQVFTPEEVFGKYLDLTTVHSTDVSAMRHVFSLQQDTDKNHSNSNSRQEVVVPTIIPYVDFLQLLSKGLSTSIPEAAKLGKDRRKYIRFLTTLSAYLHGFLRRTSPFLDIHMEIIQPATKKFNEEWSQWGGTKDDGGGSGGWAHKMAEAIMAQPNTTGSTTHKDDEGSSSSVVDLEPYGSAEELSKGIDGDVLKAELSRLGLKCGGTVLDRAKRLYMTKHTPLDQLPKKLFAKTQQPTTAATTSTTSSGSSSDHVAVAVASSSGERRVDIARLEAVVMDMLNQLRPTLDATARRAERRLTQTLNERAQEVEEEINGIDNGKPNSAAGTKKNDDDDSDDSDSEEEDAPIYNPKGVPLGWDGKPIPYWLFKLHGLNHFFKCEICGNESYRGRRNFEKHFTEQKHAHGMRCLGIPNTQHFHGVTNIQDAQGLWTKLQSMVQDDAGSAGASAKPDEQEEYEDSHGNVLSRADYEDLARQGLL